MRNIENKRKKALLLVSVLVVALIGTIAAYATIMFIKETVGPKTSTFEPTKVECSVTANDDGTYTVKNEGSIPALVRVAAVANWVYTADDDSDNKDQFYRESPAVTIDITDTAWQLEGGYYYYKGELASGGTVTFPAVATSGTAPEGNTYDLKIQILAEAIQSTPQSATQEAWGMTFNANAWEVYSTTP